MAVSDQAGLSGRIAFTYPDFVLYQVARLLIVSSLEMQSVAVGWQVYELTRRPLDLGLVGLAQFLPGILLFLVSGHAADRFERRRLILVCQIAFAICSALLLAITLRGPHAVLPIYAVLLLLGLGGLEVIVVSGGVMSASSNAPISQTPATGRAMPR